MTEPTIDSIRARVANATSTLWMNHAAQDITWLLERYDAAVASLACCRDRTRVMAERLERADERIAELEATPQRAALDLSTLSPREREVVDLLVSGVRLSAIAERLGISRHTARNHLKHVSRKLGTRSQQELISRVLGGGHG